MASEHESVSSDWSLGLHVELVGIYTSLLLVLIAATSPDQWIRIFANLYLVVMLLLHVVMLQRARRAARDSKSQLPDRPSTSAGR
jgi:hypothetical protein